MEVPRSRFRIRRVKPSFLETTPAETNVLVDFQLTRIRYMYSDSWIECPPIGFLYTFNYSPSTPPPPSSSSDSLVSDVHVSTDASDEQRFPAEENETIIQQFSRYISSQLEHVIRISSRSDNQSSRPRPSAIEIFAEGLTVEGTDGHPEMIQAVLNAFMADRTRGGVESDIVVDKDDDVITSCLQTKTFQKRSDGDDDELKDQEKDCSVCLSEFSEGENVTVTPCRHMFHERCIQRWLLRGKETCPICRFNITQS